MINHHWPDWNSSAMLRGGTLLTALAGSLALLWFSCDARVPTAAALPLLLASLLFVWLPGFAGAAIVHDQDSAGDRQFPLIAFLIGIGLSGGLGFAAWFAGPAWGKAGSLAIYSASIYIVLTRPLPWAELRIPIMLATLVAILYFAIVSDHRGLAAAQNMIAHRYWASVDNSLPKLLADALVSGREHLKPFLGDWLSSDRPPLQTGIMLLVYPMAPEILRSAFALTLGIAVNILWILGLWAFLRTLGITPRHVGFTIIAIALTGSIFINTIYVWPKMLAGAFVLLAATLTLAQQPYSIGRAVAFGACCALSLLAHGAAAFGLIGLLPLLLRQRQAWNSRALLAAFATVLVIYAPWQAYQKRFDPPGDRLLKWHLAGVVPIVPDSAGKTIINAYKNAGVANIIGFKLKNLEVLTGMADDRINDQTLQGWNGDTWGELRRRLLYFAGPAPLLALIGLFCLFDGKRRRWLAPYAATMTGMAAASCLLEYGGDIAALTWFHHLPYALVLLWTGFGILLLCEYPRLARALLLAIAASMVWLWIIGPGRLAAANGYQLGALSYPMVLTQIIAFSLLVGIAYRWMPTDQRLDRAMAAG